MDIIRVLVALAVVAGFLVAGTGVAAANHTPESGQGCERGATVSELPIPEGAIHAAFQGVSRALHSVCGGSLPGR